MKVEILFVFILTISLAYGQTKDKFVANYAITGGNLAGKITGTIYYSEPDRSILYDQDTTSGRTFKDLYVFSNDQNSLFRYQSCSGKCQIEPIAVDEEFPVFYKKTGDSCLNTPNANGCYVCTRSGNSKVQSICVDGTGANPNTESVTFKDGRILTFTSAKTGGVTSTTFTPFTGCELNCYSELDIVMVIDESGSISGNYIQSLGVNEGEWKLQREFAVDFIKNFDIGPKKVHMGLVQFSKGSRKVISSPHIISNSAQYTNIIDGLTKKVCGTDPARWRTETSCHGATYTGHGIIDGIDILLDKSGSRALRAQAGKILVLVTDGNSVYNGLSIPFQHAGRTWNVDYSGANSWKQFARDSPVTIITVGVGNGISRSQMEEYSSKDNNGNFLIFEASSFDYLKSAELIEQLGRAVCTANGIPASCGGTCKGSCECGACECPSTCNLGNLCQNDECSATVNNAGGCYYTPVVCDDGNYCTIDQCDPVTGCTYTPVDEKTYCDDNDPCTIDYCLSSVGCIHEPVECKTDNFCLVSTCDSSTGNCTAPSFNPICNDDNECTRPIGGTNSVTFEPIECPAVGVVKDKCTIYGCNPLTGCTETPKTCNDSNVCTIDTCSDGNCIYERRVCDDQNACTTNNCDPITGCFYTPMNPTTDCDDGNICTIDLCDPTKGCTHEPVECVINSTDPCIVGVCDPIEGCIEVPRTCEVPAGQEDCVIALCTNGECVETKTEQCASNDLIAAAAAAGTTLLVVIIIIAAIVLLGAGAGGAYAAFAAVSPGDFDNHSGIYVPDTTVGVSAIHQ